VDHAGEVYHTDFEESEQEKFIYHLKQRGPREKVFHVFEYMVPVHVVLPMLQSHSQMPWES